jgi:intracellular septation protein
MDGVETPVTEPHKRGNATRLLIELGPLVVFLGAYFLVKGPSAIFISTFAFMVAMAVAMIVSRLKLGHISPMLWVSGAMVLVMGSLTIWLHNDTFIKMKPTIYYAMVAVLLLYGLMSGRPMLKLVLDGAFPGMNEAGWHKLTRNFMLFFAFMAILNEVVWRHSTTEFWLGFKLWGALPMTFLFAMSNYPMALRHGMQDPSAKAAKDD